MKKALTLHCRTATTFTREGEIDEEAQRAFLSRFVDAKLGVYLGSAGSGEGHALGMAELERVYRIGVEECSGRIPVNANPPEAHTAERVIEHSLLAARCGVDVINIYGPTAWHSFRPTDEELKAYHDKVLKEVHAPVALAPNPVIGYTPSPKLVAEIANKHRQVVAINLAGTTEVYFMQLMQSLRDDVDVYVPLAGSSLTLKLGAAGLLGAEANILPKTHRRYIDLYEAGDQEELAKVYGQLRLFSTYVQKWHSASPRWIKMAMRAMQLPGWQGGVRPPYVNASDDEVAAFAEGLRKLGIEEIEAELAGRG